MKYFSVNIIIAILFLISCNKQKSSLQEIDVNQKGVFNSTMSEVLERKIDEYIFYRDSIRKGEAKKNKKTIIYHLQFYEEDETCYLLLREDFYYNKDNIQGYFFNKDNLFVYDKSNTYCIYDLINIQNVISFKDSIPGYKEINEIEGPYDLPKRLFMIVSKDSLEIIYTGM